MKPDRSSGGNASVHGNTEYISIHYHCRHRQRRMNELMAIQLVMQSISGQQVYIVYESSKSNT